MLISTLSKAANGDPAAVAEFDAWMASVQLQSRKPRFDSVSAPISEMAQRSRDAAPRRPRRKAGWFRRLIVRAAPTCTLWHACYYADYYEFVFWPRWKITALEMAEIG